MQKQVKALLNDKIFTKDNVTADMNGIVNEEFSSLGSVVKAIAWSVRNNIDNKDTYLRTQLEKLDEMTKSSYVGSDIHDNAMEKKEMFIKNLAISIEELEEFEKEILEVHVELFGTQYSKPAPRGEKVTDTASSLSAKKLLDKYGI